jgi:Cell division protein FtsI/penicillin-binding protein 2
MKLYDGRPQNNNKKNIVIVSCIIGVALIGIVTVIFMTINKNLFWIKREAKPEDTLIQYMSYINSKDYTKMYELLSDKSRAAISLKDFTTRNQGIYEGIEANDLEVHIEKIRKAENDSGGKIISYTTNMETVAGKLSFLSTVTVNEDKEQKYGIEWDSNLIFPRLGTKDKVMVRTMKGTRGSIVDRNGTVLAEDGTVSSVGLVPEKMSNNFEKDIVKLSQILNVPVETIQKKLNASYVKSGTFVPIKMISKSDTQTEDALLQIHGIKISNTIARVYPLGERAAHLTGYIQNINADELKKSKNQNYNTNSIIGKAGLEKLFEERLRASDGCEIVIIDPDGKTKQSLIKKEKKDGEAIHLTIDSQLQSKLYDQMKKDKSCSVVMNPKTGEILALVSTPAYDPNEFILGMSSDRWTKLNDDVNKPMYNRFKAALCPGSSFKPVIAAIGITTGKVDQQENYGHSGLSWQKDPSWGSYKVTTMKDYGNQVDMKNALIYSDNIYFAKAALKIGADTMSEQLLKLGFHEAIPFEFGLTASQLGADKKFDSEIQLADSGYGQGQILLNPIHMASIYSAFVNDGNMVKPYLEYKEGASPTFWKNQVFSKEAVETVRDDLVQVIESPHGTGRSGRVTGMTLAGKTGTAEIKASKDDTKGTELGWFAAFTADPGSKKPLLALTMVEDVKERGGSHCAISIVRSVFQ